MSGRFIDNARELEGSFRSGRKSGNLDDFSGRVFDMWDMINLPGVTLAPNNLMSRPSFQRAANIAFSNMPPGLKQGADAAIKVLLVILSNVVANYTTKVLEAGKGQKTDKHADNTQNPSTGSGE